MGDSAKYMLDELCDIEPVLFDVLKEKDKLSPDLAQRAQEAWNSCVSQIASDISQYDPDPSQIPERMHTHLQESDPEFYGNPGEPFRMGDPDS